MSEVSYVAKKLWNEQGKKRDIEDADVVDPG